MVDGRAPRNTVLLSAQPGESRSVLQEWFYSLSVFDFSEHRRRAVGMITAIKDRSVASNLGIYVYGGATVVLGLIGLVWGDFATGWQRVGPSVPYREALAYIAAVCEIAGGIAVLWRRTARAGALFLTSLYLVYALLWVPRMFASPLTYDPWANFFEELSAVIGGAVAFAVLAPPGSWLSRRESIVARSYGICVISFGIVHVVDLPGLPAWIPGWIPPGPVFWAYATTICFFLAAASILSGILSALAARLLTAMIVGFEILVWVPKVLAAPHDHFQWSGNGICLALAGGVWVVSDSISRTAKYKSLRVVSQARVGSAA